MITQEKWRKSASYADNDLVVCTKNGTPCFPKDLDTVWNRLRNNAQLRKITFHDLRHTHERLGHSSIQITLDTYSHLFPNMQEDAAAGLGRMIFQNKEAALLKLSNQASRVLLFL